MGYESRIHIVVPLEHYGDEIARFDLCKMGYEYVDGRAFREIFEREIDYSLYYTPTYNEDVDWRVPQNEDCYGDVCGATDLDTVIEWLEKSDVAKEWSRAACTLECLKAIRKQYGNDGIDVVHYGY